MFKAHLNIHSELCIHVFCPFFYFLEFFFSTVRILAIYLWHRLRLFSPILSFDFAYGVFCQEEIFLVFHGPIYQSVLFVIGVWVIVRMLFLTFLCRNPLTFYSSACMVSSFTLDLCFIWSLFSCKMRDKDLVFISSHGYPVVQAPFIKESISAPVIWDATFYCILIFHT